MMTDHVSASLQLGELKRLSKSMRKLARELRHTDKYEVSSFLPLTGDWSDHKQENEMYANPYLNFPPVSSFCGHFAERTVPEQNEAVG